MVPLDSAGRTELAELGGLFPVLRDPQAERRFSSVESLDGKHQFHAMSQHKWLIARRIFAELGSGAPERQWPATPEVTPGVTPPHHSTPPPVLWFDPDIALYRNPLLYMAGLPPCDVVMQAEMCGLDLFGDPADDAEVGAGNNAPTPSTAGSGFGARAAPGSRRTDVAGEQLRRLIGSSAHLCRLWHGRELLFNTGVVLLRPSNNTHALLRRLISRFEDDTAAGATRDDQVTFVNMMAHEYFIDGVEAFPPGINTDRKTTVAAAHAASRARFRHIRANTMSGRCTTFVHARSGERFSMWLLNPLLFPLRPAEASTRVYEALLEPPYLKHYNWLVGSAAKVAEMRSAGDWLLPESLGAALAVASGDASRSASRPAQGLGAPVDGLGTGVRNGVRIVPHTEL